MHKSATDVHIFIGLSNIKTKQKWLHGKREEENSFARIGTMGFLFGNQSLITSA